MLLFSELFFDYKYDDEHKEIYFGKKKAKLNKAE